MCYHVTVIIFSHTEGRLTYELELLYFIIVYFLTGLQPVRHQTIRLTYEHDAGVGIVLQDYLMYDPTAWLPEPSPVLRPCCSKEVVHFRIDVFCSVQICLSS